MIGMYNTVLTDFQDINMSTWLTLQLYQLDDIALGHKWEWHMVIGYTDTLRRNPVTKYFATE